MNSRAEIILIFEYAPNPSRAFDTATFSQGTFWNVIEGGNASGNEYAAIHKATFPEYLPRTVIENFTPIGGAVLDPFGGSGTTLIACEQLGRRAFLNDIDPAYVAVILQRWHDMTGRDPVLIEAPP